MSDEIKKLEEKISVVTEELLAQRTALQIMMAILDANSRYKDTFSAIMKDVMDDQPPSMKRHLEDLRKYILCE